MIEMTHEEYIAKFKEQLLETHLVFTDGGYKIVDGFGEEIETRGKWN